LYFHLFFIHKTSMLIFISQTVFFKVFMPALCNAGMKFITLCF